MIWNKQIKAKVPGNPLDLEGINVLYRTSRKYVHSSQSELQMSLLISDRHIDVQRWYTNMATPYKGL